MLKLLPLAQYSHHGNFTPMSVTPWQQTKSGRQKDWKFAFNTSHCVKPLNWILEILESQLSEDSDSHTCDILCLYRVLCRRYDKFRRPFTSSFEENVLS